VTASGQIGTATAGYVYSVIVMVSGGAAQVSLYNGTATTDTEKFRITAPNTAGDSRASPPLSTWFSAGCYLTVTNAIAYIEYSGFGPD
jgi:hypothetical protein